jgi:NAD(P)H-dependent FMN reductase
MTLHAGLHELPLFNPDLEPELIPAVMRWRAAVGACDALVIASPEYAHGISGPMKNALDWLVSGEEFVHKPLALWNAAPRATHAQAALREVVSVMSARLVEEAFVTVPAGSWMGDAEIAARPEISSPVAAALAALARACRADQALSASSSS